MGPQRSEVAPCAGFGQGRQDGARRVRQVGGPHRMAEGLGETMDTKGTSGDAEQRFSFLIYIFIFVYLLAGCAVSWLQHAGSLVAAFVVVQPLSHACHFATPWIASCQVPLSSTVPWSLLKIHVH